MTQLNQEDYHLFYYSLVYTEDLHAKLCQMPLIIDGLPSNALKIL